MAQEFTFKINISPDGETVEGEVVGMKGHRCSDVQNLLNEIGQEIEHRHTDDWDKREPVSIAGSTAAGIRIGR